MSRAAACTAREHLALDLALALTPSPSPSPSPSPPPHAATPTHVFHKDKSGERKLLAELGEWACFGERALLKHDARYAGIRAANEGTLHTMSIDKAGFEKAVGGTLESLIKEVEY